ncbi:MAG TPA: hypothetical protein VH740_03775 [Vicinamibacterales bacterium]
MRAYHRSFLLVASVVVSACIRIYDPPLIQLNERSNTIDVIGIGPQGLDALARVDWTMEQWQSLLRVSVKGADGDRPPAVAGRYAIAGDVLRFTPMFPLDEGRQYDVVLDPGFLPPNARMIADPQNSVRAVVGRPAVERSPSTIVTHIYPSGGVVPANQLRLYLHFSAPMDWRSGYDYVKLLDERGEEVLDAFLPLDADFWNDDRTRYTVFFDPGRVKRGILPNRQMGRALEPGKRYTLVVKREWRDGHGLPLKDEFRHAFRAAAPIERALSTSAWTIAPPAGGSRAPLSVVFPQPLDRGLLQRALHVERDGKPLDGEIAIEAEETRWSFTPREPWRPGEHQLVALAFLEDLAGNRIGRAFEVDNFERADVTPEPERTAVRFKVGP